MEYTQFNSVCEIISEVSRVLYQYIIIIYYRSADDDLK